MSAASPTRHDRPLARQTKRERTYPDTTIGVALAALDANNGNVKGTARELGIPETTLLYWSRMRGDRAMAVSNLRSRYRGDLSSLLTDVAWQALAQVQDKLPDATAKDAAVVAGISLDKRAALAALPTGVSVQVGVQLDRLSTEQLATLERWLSGTRPPAPLNVTREGGDRNCTQDGGGGGAEGSDCHINQKDPHHLQKQKEADYQLEQKGSDYPQEQQESPMTTVTGAMVPNPPLGPLSTERMREILPSKKARKKSVEKTKGRRKKKGK